MSQIEVKMPQMGVSVTEGTVTAWHKRPGDDVRAEEPICDVATDKVDTEVLAPADGVLASIVVAEGETADVGATLALLSGDGAVVEEAPATNGSAPASAAVASAAPAASTPASAAPAAIEAPESYVPNPQVLDDDLLAPATVRAEPFDHARALAETAARGGRRKPLASPVARRLAVDLGVDLQAVTGSGARGRIRKADVLAAREGVTAVVANGAVVEPTPAPSTDLPRGYEDVPYEIVPTSHVRKVTADHMIRSRQTAAHMTTEVEVDMQLVASVRAQLNAERVAGGLAKLSYLPFLTRVACHALREFPNLNATFERERYVRWGEVNVGIAVDTPQGLLVPVARRAQELTVEALADRIAGLAEGARARTLDADAFRAGTFTISNPGSVGAVSAMAIINQPQVAILGIPAIVRRPWVVALPDGSETIAIRPILQLALTFDHRAIDGAEATRAAVLMKRSLETWTMQEYR
jgi:2-oxoglutarate dehydrogenase E2 component (dihydrolipoamide succinyltransferase)